MNASPRNKTEVCSEQLIPKLALGTVQFGMNYGISNTAGQTNIEEVGEILKLAKSKGINTLDTAQGYGTSESVLGQVGVEQFEVISKLNPISLNKVRVSLLVAESLKKLRITKLYGILFHNAESALKGPRAIEEIQQEKEKGSIGKWGYSVYTPKELEELLFAYDLPDIIQVPYNHLDNRFESLMSELHEKGVEIHTRSTFLQGLFFMESEALPDFFNPVRSYLHSLQKNYHDQNTMASALLKWVVEKPFIDKVVIGVNNVRQLSSNVEGLLRAEHNELPTPQKVSDKILMPNLWPTN